MRNNKWLRNVRKLLFVLLSGFFIASVSFAGTINWGNAVPDFWVDRFTNEIPSSSDWLVAMLDAGDHSVVFSSTNGWYQPSPGSNGYFFESFTTTGTFNVYTRIYDNPTIPSAIYYCDVGPTTNRTVGDITIWDYSLPANAAGDWVFIPEPGTLTLFGLGLLTIGLRNRFRRSRNL